MVNQLMLAISMLQKNEEFFLQLLQTSDSKDLPPDTIKKLAETVIVRKQLLAQLTFTIGFERQIVTLH